MYRHVPILSSHRKNENRAQSADSSKAYSKPRDFNFCLEICFKFFVRCYSHEVSRSIQYYLFSLSTIQFFKAIDEHDRISFQTLQRQSFLHFPYSGGHYFSRSSHEIYDSIHIELHCFGDDGNAVNQVEERGWNSIARSSRKFTQRPYPK